MGGYGVPIVGGMFGGLVAGGAGLGMITKRAYGRWRQPRVERRTGQSMIKAGPGSWDSNASDVQREEDKLGSTVRLDKLPRERDETSIDWRDSGDMCLHDKAKTEGRVQDRWWVKARL
ncbi:hypothetical protein I317_05934 [Kwoniella heveanensis CBS 569]|nr:hypothetical protein I317_05934 [Kwoniella heveanensis CBS 569]